MRARQTIKELPFCVLVQIAEALSRSEAAQKERYKHLAEQATELLPAENNRKTFRESQP
jgi:uncharacterized membrane-anchored protein YhcB (DUF1043 family)